MTDITVTKKDREDILKLVNIMSGSLSKASETFDLELSDLRNLSELQWKLYHKLQFEHNSDEKRKWSEPYILREEKQE